MVLYADVPFVGCVPNTIGYCCFTTDVADASVSAFFPLREEEKEEEEEEKTPSAEKNLNYKNLCELI